MKISSNNNNYKILVNKQKNTTYQLNQWEVAYHKVANFKKQNIIKQDKCIILNTFSLNKRKNKINYCNNSWKTNRNTRLRIMGKIK